MFSLKASRCRARLFPCCDRGGVVEVEVEFEDVDTRLTKEA
jgi:hypothetical protein